MSEMMLREWSQTPPGEDVQNWVRGFSVGAGVTLLACVVIVAVWGR